MPSIIQELKTAVLNHQAGNIQQAEVRYRSILQIEKNQPEALHGLGIIAFQSKKYGEALGFISKAIEHKPDAPQFHYNLGLVLVALKKQEEAIQAFQHAIKFKTDFADAYYNLALAQKKQNQFEDAIKNFQQSIQFSSDNANAWYNLGNIFKTLNQHETAVECYRQTIKRNPGFDKTYNNMALVQQEQGRMDEAIRNNRHALHLKPEFAEYHWNLSIALLLNGELSEGWKEYEWRFMRAELDTTYPYQFGIPRWDGSSFKDKRLFVHSEQGMGDTLQFIRYLPLVKSLGGTVIFETYGPLFNLLKGFPGVDELVELAPDRSLPEKCDFHVPLMSLAHVFGTTIHTIPSSLPYIFSSHKKADQWKACINGKEFKVGIVWAGKPEHENDQNRSCMLEHFTVLAGIPGLKLCGLQKGAGTRQTASLDEKMHMINFDAELIDFSDTAAAIENLDLIISVDTAVAHLAGAMGKPVWTLLPFAPDWRWMLERNDSPWYPTMRLFRQKNHGDWDSVFKLIALELEKLRLRTKMT